MKLFKIIFIWLFLFFVLFLGFQNYAIAASIYLEVVPQALTTKEGGRPATFNVTVKNGGYSTFPVNVTVISNNMEEGTVKPAAFTVTWKNRNKSVTVSVSPVDDGVVDGDQPYSIILQGTPKKGSLTPVQAVMVTNQDNDTPSTAKYITVTPTSGLITTEAGGTDTFTVVLDSQPTANVTIALSSSDTTEGTVAPASITFTHANWSNPQTVTVTGVDDNADDGPIAYTIVTSAAISADTTGCSGPNPADVSVTNSDNDTAGITVTPASGLITTETGGTDTFTVVLNSEPTADVTIGLSSSDTTEGRVAPSSLIFTRANWNNPQIVTITGVNDNIIDGPVAYTIVTLAAVSTDTAGYSGINPADVSVTNVDNNTTGITTAGITVTPASGLTTTEAGGQSTFTVRLTSQPTANVTIALTSSNSAEGIVLPANLIFTSANWSNPQTVTVTGIDDYRADGTVSYTIITAPAVSNDTTGYKRFNPPDMSVANYDNDTANVTVNPAGGLTTTEAGGQDNFTVRLTSQPTANVTIALRSSNTAEGTVSPSSLTFTPANWSNYQTVTVTGVDDHRADGRVSYTIITSAAVSYDTTGYNGLDPADVSVFNTDNEALSVPVLGKWGKVALFSLFLVSLVLIGIKRRREYV